MNDELNELPLWGWASTRLAPRVSEVVDLGRFREGSARWRLAIEPRAIGALERFDRLVGLVPTPAIAHLDAFRPKRRA